MSFKSSLTIEKGFASAWTSATAAAARRGAWRRAHVTGPRSARTAVASMTIAHRMRRVAPSARALALLCVASRVRWPCFASLPALVSEMRWLVRKSQSVDLEQHTRGRLRAIDIQLCRQTTGTRWSRLRLRWREMSFIEPSRAHLCRREAPVDGSLGHLGRAGSNINKQAPPAGGRADAGEPKNPMTDRRRRRARLRREAPLHGPTLTPGHDPRKTTAPRATRSPGQERTTFVLLTSLGQWTGDNRGTGDVAGGVHSDS